jgi:hypothetical protein
MLRAGMHPLKLTGSEEAMTVAPALNKAGSTEKTTGR